jgi:uncharacterized membrane protein YcaP (DUF421 family)
MMEAAEYSFDVKRIFLGDYSPVIYAEILIRVLIILTYTMFIIRWIGKRAVGGIDSGDILLVIAMGSCVGDAMFYPAIPLLISIMVISTIGFLQRLYTELSIKSETARRYIHPTVVKIVEHGKILKDNISKDNLDKHEVLMLLRQEGVRYLEEVECAYFEQSGQLSLYRYDEFKKETSILPEDIEEIPHV